VSPLHHCVVSSDADDAGYGGTGTDAIVDVTGTTVLLLLLLLLLLECVFESEKERVCEVVRCQTNCLN
jgi:hypothetical protein